MELPGLVASHTSDDEAFYASQVVQKKGAQAQKPSTECKDWLVQPYKTERDHPNIEKLTALMMYNAQSLLICGNMNCEQQIHLRKKKLFLSNKNTT